MLECVASCLIFAALGFLLFRAWIYGKQEALFRLKRVRNGKRKFNVVVTGGSRGLGYSMTRKFLEAGDNVLICGREYSSVSDAVRKLKVDFPDSTIVGKAVDVSEHTRVQYLVVQAQKELGGLDIWVNNAGIGAPEHESLLDSSVDGFKKVLGINLFGAIVGCREALRFFREQGHGHVFNIEGAGSDGRATPMFSVYGATKSAVRQLSKTLAKEIRLGKMRKIGVHTVSPGMVVTNLLARHTREPKAARILNLLSERPDVVADYLVPRMRHASGNGRHIAFLKPESAIFRMIFKRKAFAGRFFDEETGAVKTDVAKELGLTVKKQFT